MPLARNKLYTAEDYYNLPDNIRAELVDGYFIYNQAAPSRIHQEILMELSGTIHNYLKEKNGPCRVYPAPLAVKLNEKAVVEPDISVVCDPDKLTKQGCTGAPDWIIEIVSPNNSSHDYIFKLNLYANAGVREYWIVDPDKNNVFVYCLEEEHFKAGSYTFHDKITVSIYSDFQIDFSELDFH